MTRVVGHLKHNLVAYLALFVALGGTSYAALRIPAGSVGSRQLKDHSVAPVKLDGGKTAGYVADWAQIGDNGHLVASSPRRATILNWNATPNTPAVGGSIRWSHTISAPCIAMASTAGVPAADPASVSAEITGPINRPYVFVRESAPTAVNVAVICGVP